jgi:hypothetical protein
VGWSTPARRSVQACLPVAVRVLQLGALGVLPRGGEKQLNDGGVRAERRAVDRQRLVELLHHGVRALLEQQRDGGGVSAAAREVQRGDGEVLARVHVGLRLEEEATHLGVPVRSCTHERCPTGCVAAVNRDRLEEHGLLWHPVPDVDVILGSALDKCLQEAAAGSTRADPCQRCCACRERSSVEHKTLGSRRHTACGTGAGDGPHSPWRAPCRSASRRRGERSTASESANCASPQWADSLAKCRRAETVHGCSALPSQVFDNIRV